MPGSCLRSNQRALGRLVFGNRKKTGAEILLDQDHRPASALIKIAQHCFLEFMVIPVSLLYPAVSPDKFKQRTAALIKAFEV
jgi:hypothetical protein